MSVMQRWEWETPDPERWHALGRKLAEEQARPEDECRHCGRVIVLQVDGYWADPEATGDDAVWRETCDEHHTFTAEHEPRDRWTYPRTLRQDVLRSLTHPLTLAGGLFVALVVLGLWGGGFL